MAFLYEDIKTLIKHGHLDHTEIPDCITGNFKQNFTLRPYQLEAFQRFIYFNENNFQDKQNKPYHLLYNMATGSGKTLIMAGLILYLFSKGYRNFLFFVNSNNIIQKTKENFLNPKSSKYLFSDKITVEGQEILVKEIQNFDDSDDKNINIKFVSIQMLTSGLLLNVRENGLSFEDFDNRKLVLIGDEAHHNNAEVWGDLVEKIHQKNLENVLLEFTATTDYEDETISQKYKNKVLFRYDLAQFRNDGFSKEINLIRSQYGEKERILQALILNLYRQELAAAHNVNLKPVILFKAKRTIVESAQNKANFHQLIDNLNETDIAEIRNTSTINVVQKAFVFFTEQNISDAEIVSRTQANFKLENCLSANNDKEAEANQIRLNSLEDGNNPIRAIFAVQKLNEGWDVLNLFDIVRLYEERNEEHGRTIGRTTIAEAQLIGRGARYFPFALDADQNKYTRKYDNDINNDLKVLEELYYHTKEDSRYISELKNALVASGIYEDDRDLVTRQLTLKPDFKKTEFYQKAQVIFNLKKPKDYTRVMSFRDLNITKHNVNYTLSSGAGMVSNVFESSETQDIQTAAEKSVNVKIIDIPKNVLHFAIDKNHFFNFDNLQHYFPNIKSIDEFMSSQNYLGGCEITLNATTSRLCDLSNTDYLYAVGLLLQSIENEMMENITEYEGTKEYFNKYLHEVFGDKEIRVNRNNERADGQESFVANESWYVYNANYGTSEEKSFVKMFARRFKSLCQKFDDIYLVRNEKTLKIFDEQGRAFEPDFLLFCKQKNSEGLIYQVFIEPKGAHLMAHDKWKENFLKNICKNKTLIEINSDKYLITGVPFYNSANENSFAADLENVLK